jgi:hypothetical protein
MGGDPGPEKGNSVGNGNSRDKSDESRRRRIGKWVAGVAATVVAAVLAAILVPYFTSVGKHVSASLNQPGQPGGPPVKIDLVTLEQGPNQSRVLPTSLVLSASQLSSLNSLSTSGVQNWFAGHGAVTSDGVLIQLVLQGNRNNSVRIVNMQPLVRCHAPLTGTLFYSPSAGADLNTQMLLNLDEPFAPSKYIANVNGQASSGTNFFQHFTVSLKHNEQFTFLVNASTNKQYCAFTLKMTVLDGTHTVTETVSDNGKPFRVTAIYGQNSLNQGAFSRYHELYVGGVAASGLKGSGQNQFGDPLWLHVNPASYRQ